MHLVFVSKQKLFSSKKPESTHAKRMPTLNNKVKFKIRLKIKTRNCAA